MADRKLILFWEQIGEQGAIYVLDAESDAAQWARESAGCYINGDDLADDHPIFKLNDWLGSAKAVVSGSPIYGPFEEAVVCGFFL